MHYHKDMKPLLGISLIHQLATETGKTGYALVCHGDTSEEIKSWQKADSQ